jgi:hypothetical protein
MGFRGTERVRLRSRYHRRSLPSSTAEHLNQQLAGCGAVAWNSIHRRGGLMSAVVWTVSGNALISSASARTVWATPSTWGSPDPRVFIDNDIWAFDGGRRPDYDAMVAAVASGASRVVVWHVYRLHRQPRELTQTGTQGGRTAERQSRPQSLTPFDPSGLQLSESCSGGIGVSISVCSGPSTSMDLEADDTAIVL